MRAIVASEKEVSDKKAVEGLLTSYFEFEKQKKEAAKETLKLKDEILAIAEKHPEWFQGKTATMENGKLKWKAGSKMTKPEDFDMGKFKKKFPNLVKVSETIDLSKARGYEGDPAFEKYGIVFETKDTFAIEAV